MFSFFLHATVSIFVPYSATEEPIMEQVVAADIDNFVESNSKVILLGTLPNSRRSARLEKIFVSSSIRFEGHAKFLILDQEQTKEYAQNLTVSAPFIAVFSNGKLASAYPFPDILSQVLSLMKFAIFGLEEKAETEDEIFSRLGPGAFTLVASTEHIKSAVELAQAAGAQMGFINVVETTKDVITKAFNETDLVLYRSEDEFAVPVTYNLDYLYDASYPIFRNLMRSDLEGEKALIFAVVAPELTEPLRDFLISMGEVFANDVIVGYAGRHVRSMVEDVVDEVFTDSLPHLTLFNYSARCHYNVSLPAESFREGQWPVLATFMISSVLHNSIPAIYLSEDLSLIPDEERQNYGTATILDGKMYNEFVHDPEHDVVILYKRTTCPHCTDFLPIFANFTKECEDAKLDFLKFGLIDIEKNSVEGGFPNMQGVPHVEVFPKENKTDHHGIIGSRDRDAIIRLLKKHVKGEIPFEAAEMDQGMLAMQMLQMLFQVKDMNPEEQMKTLDMMKEMSSELGLDLGEDNETEVNETEVNETDIKADAKVDAKAEDNQQPPEHDEGL